MSDIVKAVARGTLFGGTVECFVLEDERRVISVGGMRSALSASGKGPFDRYLARLSDDFASLAVPPDILVSPPEGRGPARCFSAAFLIDVANAYVCALARGELRAEQLHMAVAASAILTSTAKVGIEALIDEATGFQEIRGKDHLARLYTRYIAAEMTRWDCVWSRDIVVPLCRVLGIRYAAGRLPAPLSAAMNRIYRLIFGDAIIDEIKRRNPDPHFKSNHHQLIKHRPQLRSDLETVSVIARTSRSAAEFWNRVNVAFQGGPLQLWLGGAA